MRNLLDTASIAQSLDSERLTGSLPFPKQRIFLDRAGYKDVQTSAQESRGRNSAGSARTATPGLTRPQLFQERYFERPSDPKVPMSIKVTMPGDEEATAKIDIDLLKAAEALPPPPPELEDAFMGYNFLLFSAPSKSEKKVTSESGPCGWQEI